MGLKILHSADWHLDSPFGSFPEDRRKWLQTQQRSIPGKIADLCRREKCDMMLLSGDLFDGKPSRETLELVKKTLGETGVPVMIAPGNHDFCGPGSLWLEESWPKNVFIFKGKLESVALPELNCRVYGAGFQSIDCAAVLEGFRAAGEEQFAVGVFHGDPVQRNSPYNAITNLQVRNSGLDYLALGHIHKAGAFRSGNTLCAWPGCPMGRGWDETGEKGVCIVTLGEEAQVQAISLDTLRFYDLEVDVGSDAALALEAVLPGAGSGDFYRLTLTGWGKPDVEALKEKFAAFPNLELRDRTEEPVDLWGDTDQDTLEGLYFHMLRKTMEQQPENTARVQLAAEISRKLLSGREVTL